MMQMARMIVVAAASTVAALTLSLLAFSAIVVPFDRFPGPVHLQKALLMFDAPVSVANRVYPDQYRTHAVYFIGCSHTYCFPGTPPVEAARYVRAGLPAYVMLFYASGFAFRRLKGSRPGRLTGG
jgi:hypothetical protein